MPQLSLSPHGMTVRRYDRDRFVTALFAPSDRREDLFTLYAFNLEIARIRETVSEPMLGRIRLQWWRDLLDRLFEGTRVGHPVADDLASLLVRHRLPRHLVERLLDARELDMDEFPIETMASLEAYVEDSSAGLATMATLALGVDDAASLEAARKVGQAWGLVGLLRAHAWHIGARRLYLPSSLLAEFQLDKESVLAGEVTLAPVAEKIARLAEERLREARALRRQLDKAALPALLPARLADFYLAALRKRGFDLMDRSWSAVASRPVALLIANGLGRF